MLKFRTESIRIQLGEYLVISHVARYIVTVFFTRTIPSISIVAKYFVDKRASKVKLQQRTRTTQFVTLVTIHIVRDIIEYFKGIRALTLLRLICRTILRSRPYRTYTRYTRASASHRCVGTLEAPTSYGNNRLCLRAVGARKLVEILIKGAIPLLPTDKYELHPQCSYPAPAPLPLSLFTVPTNENGKNVSCYTSYGATSLRLPKDQDWTTPLKSDTATLRILSLVKRYEMTIVFFFLSFFSLYHRSLRLSIFLLPRFIRIKKRVFTGPTCIRRRTR